MENAINMKIENVQLGLNPPVWGPKPKVASWTQGQVYSDGEKVYDVEILKELTSDNREFRMPVKDLIENLYDEDAWEERGRPISPMMVMKAPTFDHVFVSHMSKIRTADLSEPILVRFKTQKVIDGYHRLARAFLQGENRISVVMVQEEQMNQAVFCDVKNNPEGS